MSPLPAAAPPDNVAVNTLLLLLVLVILVFLVVHLIRMRIYLLEVRAGLLSWILTLSIKLSESEDRQHAAHRQPDPAGRPPELG